MCLLDCRRLDARNAYRLELHKNASQTGGITSHLNLLHDILVQKNPVFPNGLIGALLSKLETTMVKDDNMDFGIDWYLGSTYHFMANFVTVQKAGLAVQLFMSSADRK